MNKFIILLIFVVCSIWPGYAESPSRFGLVDGEKLFDEYPSAQDASKKIADAQDELKKEITESEKVYSEFEKQKKSEAEKLIKQRELQTKIDAKAQETRKLIEALSAKIEDDILLGIKKISSEKGLDVVFDKRAVLLGGVDITQVVIDHLKKKAPVTQKGELDKKDKGIIEARVDTKSAE